MKLSVIEKAKMRRALTLAGIDQATINAMTDRELAAVYNGVEPERKPEPVEPVEPEQEQPIMKQEPKPVAAEGVALAISQAIGDAISGFKPSLDEQAIIDLINRHATKTVTKHHHITISRPDLPDVEIKGAHPALKEVVDILACDENAYIVGGAGSGKTTLAVQAAEALDTDFYMVGSVLDKYELTGFVDGAGRYHRTPFRDAVEHGGVFLFDEIDGSLPSAVLAFNAALENGRYTFPDNATIEIDKSKTFFIAAANTVGTGANRQYVGRYELDRATLDRFIQIEVGYDNGIERAMAVNAFKQAGGKPEHESVATHWCDEVQTFRALLDERRILALCTPRATRHGAKLLARGWSFDRVKEVELFKHLSADQRKQLGV
jgi:cobaltochelatase CobS